MVVLLLPMFNAETGVSNPEKISSHKDPILGLDLFFIMGKAMKAGKMLETTQELFRVHGRTFQVNSPQPSIHANQRIYRLS